MRYTLTWILCFILLPTLGQIPVRPNAYDADSLKTGGWIEFLDGSRAVCDESSEFVTYYRLSSYKKGFQVGPVELFYYDTQTIFERKNYVGNPPKLDGEFFRYSQAGNIVGAWVLKAGNVDAELSKQQVIKIVKKYEQESAGVEEHARILRFLGSMQAISGDLYEAEVTLNKALSILENIYGKGHEETTGILSELPRRVYIPLGKFEKALESYMSLVELYEKLGEGKYKGDPQVNLNIGVYERGISECYEWLDEKEKSIEYARSSYERIAKQMGEENVSTTQSRWRLTEALLSNRLNNQAVNFAKGTFSGLTQNSTQIYFAVSHQLLGRAYLANFQDSLANIHFDKASELTPESSVETRRKLRMIVSNAYLLQNRKEDAFELRSMLFKEHERQLEYLFDNLGESDREKLYNSQKNLFEVHKFSMFEEHEDNPQLISEVFDYQLNYKGLLLNTSNGIRDRIMKSGDRKLIDLFDEVQLLKQEVLNNSGDSIENLLQKKDKELTQLSTIYKSKSFKYGWKDVQEKLGPKEAAVEVIRIRHYNYRFQQHEDSISYAMLVVTPKTKEQPEIIVFDDGKFMEGRAAANYNNSIKYKIGDNRSYDVYWKPVEKTLKKYKRIYFSPDGIYHKMNLHTLYNTRSGQYLIDEKDIVLTPNLSHLLQDEVTQLQSSLGLLVGNPDFSKGENKDLESLPGTEKEVNNIAKKLEADWRIETLTGRNASEIALKDMLKPKILHIATHGFFAASNDKSLTRTNNPMLNSGLYLAWQEDSKEDGILTAHEAMNLNVNNTDLVVLSACETGLGEVRNGEGVYGLQRAFQIAGVRTLLMSLWKVDDTATEELMSLFYDNLLRTSDKRSSFRLSQDKLRERYPHPYFWGAFVMLGE